MKKIIPLLFLFVSLTSYAQKANKVQWLTIAEAEKANKKDPSKKIFIDFYTDWCGWCKKMDITTFQDKEVAKLLNEKFLAVKFDAESKDSFTYAGQEYKYVSAGSSGINTFAYALLRGNASFPSFVIVDEAKKQAEIIAGYQTPEMLTKILKAIP